MSTLASTALFAWVPAWLPALAPWFGLATLTIVLLVAFRTRWQRTPVLVRCVVLSLYAHLLFAWLVVSTNLFAGMAKSPGKGDAGAGDVHIRLTNDIAAEEATPREETTPIEPWEATPEPPPELLPIPEIADTKPPVKNETLPEMSNPTESPLFAELPRMEVETNPSKPADSLSSVAEVLAEVAPRYADAITTTPLPPEIAPTASPPQTTAAPSKPIAIPKQEHQAVPNVYRLRFQHDAGQLAAAGGSPDTEAAVKAALAWLANNQERDGHWSAARHEAGRGNPQLGQERGDTGADADTGITGLALLAFLGSGQTHLEGEHRVVVQKGLEYLLTAQRQDGSLAGNAKLYASMYCHGMATFALAEAMAITGDQRLRPYLERAVAYTVDAQHARGGWRYQPGDLGDMSQFGWQVMALKSAELAGVQVPAITKERAVIFLHSVSSGRTSALASYRAGERVSRTMTAEAMLCRHLLGTHVDPEMNTEAATLLLQELPSARSVNIYYWYYGTLALRFSGGRSWQTWNDSLQSELLYTQRHEGPQQGSWNPDATWGSYGGRVFQTSLSALCLEAYYRYDTASINDKVLR